MAGRVFSLSQWPALEARLSGIGCRIVPLSGFWLDCCSVGHFQTKQSQKSIVTALSLSEPLKWFLLIFLGAGEGNWGWRVLVQGGPSFWLLTEQISLLHTDLFSVLSGVLVFGFLVPKRSLRTVMSLFWSYWLPKDQGEAASLFHASPEMIDCHCHPTEQPRTALFHLQRRNR